ncbi:hypothetical protein DFH27DRAFT_625421 [Peziza echinospora]|nr:hypothetical protein DFH27DRAFT_625421 [Peziza echinospora]
MSLGRAASETTVTGSPLSLPIACRLGSQHFTSSHYELYGVWNEVEHNFIENHFEVLGPLAIDSVGRAASETTFNCWQRIVLFAYGLGSLHSPSAHYELYGVWNEVEHSFIENHFEVLGPLAIDSVGRAASETTVTGSPLSLPIACEQCGKHSTSAYYDLYGVWNEVEHNFIENHFDVLGPLAIDSKIILKIWDPLQSIQWVELHQKPLSQAHHSHCPLRVDLVASIPQVPTMGLGRAASETTVTSSPLSLPIACRRGSQHFTSGHYELYGVWNEVEHNFIENHFEVLGPLAIDSVGRAASETTVRCWQRIVVFAYGLGSQHSTSAHYELYGVWNEVEHNCIENHFEVLGPLAIDSVGRAASETTVTGSPLSLPIACEQCGKHSTSAYYDLYGVWNEVEHNFVENHFEVLGPLAIDSVGRAASETTVNCWQRIVLFAYGLGSLHSPSAHYELYGVWNEVEHNFIENHFEVLGPLAIDSVGRAASGTTVKCWQRIVVFAYGLGSQHSTSAHYELYGVWNEVEHNCIENHFEVLGPLAIESVGRAASETTVTGSPLSLPIACRRGSQHFTSGHYEFYGVWSEVEHNFIENHFDVLGPLAIDSLYGVWNEVEHNFIENHFEVLGPLAIDSVVRAASETTVKCWQPIVVFAYGLGSQHSTSAHYELYGVWNEVEHNFIENHFEVLGPLAIDSVGRAASETTITSSPLSLPIACRLGSQHSTIAHYELYGVWNEVEHNFIENHFDVLGPLAIDSKIILKIWDPLQSIQWVELHQKPLSQAHHSHCPLRVDEAASILQVATNHFDVLGPLAIDSVGRAASETTVTGSPLSLPIACRLGSQHFTSSHYELYGVWNEVEHNFIENHFEVLGPLAIDSVGRAASETTVRCWQRIVVFAYGLGSQHSTSAHYELYGVWNEVEHNCIENHFEVLGPLAIDSVGRAASETTVTGSPLSLPIACEQCGKHSTSAYYDLYGVWNEVEHNFVENHFEVLGPLAIDSVGRAASETTVNCWQRIVLFAYGLGSLHSPSAHYELYGVWNEVEHNFIENHFEVLGPLAIDSVGPAASETTVTGSPLSLPIACEQCGKHSTSAYYDLYGVWNEVEHNFVENHFEVLGPLAIDSVGRAASETTVTGSPLSLPIACEQCGKHSTSAYYDLYGVWNEVEHNFVENHFEVLGPLAIDSVGRAASETTVNCWQRIVLFAYGLGSLHSPSAHYELYGVWNEVEHNFIENHFEVLGPLAIDSVGRAASETTVTGSPLSLPIACEQCGKHSTSAYYDLYGVWNEVEHNFVENHFEVLGPLAIDSVGRAASETIVNCWQRIVLFAYGLGSLHSPSAHYELYGVWNEVEHSFIENHFEVLGPLAIDSVGRAASETTVTGSPLSLPIACEQCGKHSTSAYYDLYGVWNEVEHNFIENHFDVLGPLAIDSVGRAASETTVRCWQRIVVFAYGLGSQHSTSAHYDLYGV